MIVGAEAGAAVDAVALGDSGGDSHLQRPHLVVRCDLLRGADEDAVCVDRRADIDLDTASQPVDVGP